MKKKKNVNYNADKIVAQCLDEGLTHQEMANICGVTVASIYRWKKDKRAKANVIKKLESYLEKGDGDQNRNLIYHDKLLSKATLEDLSKRARELGFRATFVDIG